MATSFPLSSFITGQHLPPDDDGQTGNAAHAAPGLREGHDRDTLLTAKDPRAQARGLARALAEELQKENALDQAEWSRLLPLFIRIKQADRKLDCLRGDGAAPELGRLASQLKVCLEKLCRHCEAGTLRFEHIDIHGVRACCNLLTACIGDSRNGGLLGRKLRECGDDIVTLNDLLLARALACGLPDKLPANGVLLDILNAQRRGLDAGVFAPTLPMRSLAERALSIMETWPVADGRSLPVSDAGKLVPRQLGKTMVQLKMFIAHGLLAKATYGQRLAALALQLCNTDALDELRWHEEDAKLEPDQRRRVAVEGVQITNICNTFKDFLDPSLALLQPDAPGLAGTAARLCELMPQIQEQGLSQRGWQTLSNCANFLRSLCEMGFAGTPVLPFQQLEYQNACAWILDRCISLDAAGEVGSGQSVANLASYVKAIDREDRQLLAQRRAAARAMVHQAAHVVDLVGTEGLAGLLPALAWIRSRGLVTDEVLREALDAALSRLLQRVKDDAQDGLKLSGIDGVPRGLLLLLDPVKGTAAISPLAQAASLALLRRGWRGGDNRPWLLLAERVIEAQPDCLPDLQDSLRRLLGWRASRPIGLEDIRHAIVERGATREVAEPLPSAPEVAQPAPKPGIPGATRIVATPVMNWSDALPRAQDAAAPRKGKKRESPVLDGEIAPGLVNLPTSGLRMRTLADAEEGGKREKTASAASRASAAQGKAPSAASGSRDKRKGQPPTTTAATSAKSSSEPDDYLRFASLLRNGGDDDLPELKRLAKAKHRLTTHEVEWHGVECMPLLIAIGRGNARIAAWLGNAHPSASAIGAVLDGWLSLRLVLGDAQKAAMSAVFSNLPRVERQRLYKQLDTARFAEHVALAALLREFGMLGTASALADEPAKPAKPVSARLTPPKAGKPTGMEGSVSAKSAHAPAKLASQPASEERATPEEHFRKAQEIATRLRGYGDEESDNIFAVIARHGDLEAAYFLQGTEDPASKLESVDKLGRTPLSIALDHKHVEVARLLLNMRSAQQLLIRDHQGLSAFARLMTVNDGALRQRAAFQVLAEGGMGKEAGEVMLYARPPGKPGIHADFSGSKPRFSIDTLPEDAPLRRLIAWVFGAVTKPIKGAAKFDIDRVELSRSVIEPWAQRQSVEVRTVLTPKGGELVILLTSYSVPIFMLSECASRKVDTHVNEATAVRLAPTATATATAAAAAAALPATASASVSGERIAAAKPMPVALSNARPAAARVPQHHEADAMETMEFDASSSEEELVAAQALPPALNEEDSESMHTAEESSSNEEELPARPPSTAGRSVPNAAPTYWRNPAAGLYDWFFGQKKRPGQ